MKSFQLFFGALFLAHGVWSQFTVPPDTTADPNTIKTCTWWHVAESSDSCASIASLYGITSEQFARWNPSIATACKLTVGNSYCIENNFGQDDGPGPSTSSSTLVGTTTVSVTASPTTGNGISTPTPTQEGMVGNCNKFHFVQPDQSCTTIGSTYGVSLTQLVAWNPAIGSQCTGLWANTYLCVGVVGSSTTLTTTTKAATTTSSGNGITTPTPTQAGMVGNCDRFHLVKSGDQCDTIASTYGITLANFYSWNPAVGKSCESLWLDTYVCVRTIGFVPPKTTTTTATTRKTTTTTAGGVATPTPTQPGMVSGCKKFHKVASGDQCDTIATRYGISLANFYSWNPAVGSSCKSLWLDYYVCVGR